MDPTKEVAIELLDTQVFFGVRSGTVRSLEISWKRRVTFSSSCQKNLVVATQIFLIFTPNFGENFQFDEHIFQVG